MTVALIMVSDGSRHVHKVSDARHLPGPPGARPLVRTDCGLDVLVEYTRRVEEGYEITCYYCSTGEAAETPGSPPAFPENTRTRRKA